MNKMGRPKKEKPMTKTEEVAVDAMLEGVEDIKVPLQRRGNITPAAKKQHEESLKSILSEFMSGYIIIGYDHNEDEVCVSDYMDSKMRREAVLAFFDKIYMTRQQSHQMMLEFGPDPDFDDDDE
jgi:hypothetical protein